MRWHTGFSGRAPARLLALVVIAALSTGFAGLFGGGPFRAVDDKPFLDKPGRLTVFRLTTPHHEGTLSAVIVNFGGQALRGESVNLVNAGTGAGSIREFITSDPEPFQFNFFEVRDRGGKTLGYLLTHDVRLEGYYLGEDGAVVLDAYEPARP